MAELDSAGAVLKEGAVVRVGSVRVGCGNLWEREGLGMSARVDVGGAALVVGVGTELTIDGVRYRVAAIEKPAARRGSVRLEPLR